MRKQFIIILLALLAVFCLMMSCKNEVSDARISEELVSVSFREEAARGLTASLEGFDKDHLYWAYAAQKADGSHLISGQTAKYGEEDEVRVWVKTDGDNNPVEGLGTGEASSYVPYKVAGFSQGYWNFRLYAYKRVNTGTTESPVYEYNLVYQGETKNALLKSDSVNAQGSHMVSVTVDPVQSDDNGTMVFLTDKMHAAAKRISMNTVNSAIYGEHYTVKVLSILSMEEIPTEYVGTAAEKKAATDSQDGEYSLPAGSYKVTVAFTNDADNPAVNYAKGTIVATVYSNLTTTISGDLTEAMTYAEFDGILNPDLETVIASKDDIVIVDPLEIQTVILKTDTSAAKEVTATIKTTDTNSIINNMAEAAGTSTGGYDQTLELTLSVETVETTATTATYEIGMTAELTSSKTGVEPVVTTSDVSEVDDYVIVEVQLETGLTQVNVLHDGKQMIPGLESEDPDKVGTFAYNAVSGILTIKTMSFSPFEVSFVKPAETSYVAQVGKVKYQSLAAAISAAKTDGTDTITLLNDVSLTSETDISKKVVLDLAGYTIAAEAGLEASVAETTIKNGSIVGALTVSGSNIGLSAVTVTGSVDVSGSAAFDSDCSVTGTAGVAYAINVTGSIAIEGGTYAAAEGENKYILSGNATISDGNFKGKLAPANAENIVLTGGTYSEMQAASRLAQGCECVEISDGVFKVRNIVEAVNVNTGVEYFHLQNAIDAASAGDKIKLLRNITLKSGIVITKGITLDGDGHTVTAVRENMSFPDVKLWDNDDQCYYSIKDYSGLQGAFIVFSNDVSATQADWMKTKIRNLTVNATNVIAVSFIQYVNGEIDHVTITSEKNRGISAGNASRESVFVKVTDCTVNESGQVSPSAWNAAAVAAMCGASVEIDGGSYNGYFGIYIYSSGGKIVVNESEGKTTSITGTFNAVRHDNWANPYITEFDINGGSFDGKIALETNQPVANVRISISGGSFTHFSYQYDSFGDFITGGTFDANPSAYVVDGYYAKDNGDGTWTVKEITEDDAVAKITVGEIIHYYLTLNAAFTAANSMENPTIVMLKDASYSNATLTSNVTIDLNGKTITNYGNYKITANNNLTVKNGGFVAKNLALTGNQNITFENVSINRVFGNGAQFFQIYGKSGLAILFDDCEISYSGSLPSSNKNNNGLVGYTGGTLNGDTVEFKETTIDWPSDIPLVSFAKQATVCVVTFDVDSYSSVSNLDNIGYTSASSQGYLIKQVLEDGVYKVRVILGEYWTDKVTSKPAEYVEDGDSIQIGSAEAFAWFAKQGETEGFTGKTITLTADIDMSEYIWKPIRSTFAGTFDGGEHTISGIYSIEGYTVNDSGTKYGNGIFHRVSGTIRNLTVSNANVGTSDNTNIVGAVAGYCTGNAKFESIAVNNSQVIGFGKVAGIVGMQEDGTITMSNCSVSNIVIEGAYNCAGLIGLTQGTVNIEGCSSTGITLRHKYSLTYVYHDMKEGDHLGLYWEDPEDEPNYYYAAWGDYYTDYVHSTVGDITFIGDCHNN